MSTQKSHGRKQRLKKHAMPTRRKSAIGSYKTHLIPSCPPTYRQKKREKRQQAEPRCAMYGVERNQSQLPGRWYVINDEGWIWDGGQFASLEMLGLCWRMQIFEHYWQAACVGNTRGGRLCSERWIGRYLTMLNQFPLTLYDGTVINTYLDLVAATK
jgi:hypothetical protein